MEHFCLSAKNAKSVLPPLSEEKDLGKSATVFVLRKEQIKVLIRRRFAAPSLNLPSVGKRSCFSQQQVLNQDVSPL